MPQLSQSGRVVTLVAVSRGQVYYANAGDVAWLQATNNTGETPPLNITGLVRSAANQQKLWFADGTNWVYYVPITNTVETWAVGTYVDGDLGGNPGDPKGALPVDSDGNTPRLICTWRGRTVLSGLLLDPQNWFMSAVGDPTDFDYAPLSASPSDAVAGNNGPAGVIGDVCTAIVPYTDDVLVAGGDHSISIFRGDPLAGGQIDIISNVIGFAWGEAFCLDPFGNIYFYSNKMGIYQMVPGNQPQRISQAIDSALFDVDTGANGIRLLWDDRYQGFHVFITPLEQPLATTHYFYEAPTNSWWEDSFGDDKYNPLCCTTFDGNLPEDRVSLLGSWDGYVRSISPTARMDDRKKINSIVYLGPFLTQNLDSVLLKDMQAVLGEGSGTVDFDVYIGETAEQAFNSEPILSGTWEAGRNFTTLVRVAAYALYVKLSSSEAWALESIRMRLASSGKVRQRGRDF